ncbi:HAMP domain-containing protein [Epibacterium sp. SM1979]|uniref:HAMP domain-containing protein n=1 Tax=Tritonibacter litoralis TaxID=2662264 RepID=A0A843YJC5_9RHOB|nr:methyl-accepting chemotaxis protein [Tritonibacter litoralis]MQQ09343.1 HAMP domain-containing protein [Tritonibacter litoralis]
MISRILRSVNGLSLFTKSLTLLVVSTLSIAALMFVSSEMLLNKSVVNGVNNLGRNVTYTVAARSGGAIRFGDSTRLTQDLSEILTLTEGRAVYGAALNQEGEILAEAGEADATQLAAVKSATEAALESKNMTEALDGLATIAPALAGKERDVAIGTVVFIWSPELDLASVQMDKLLALGIAAAAFFLMAGTSALLLRRSMGIPLARVAQELNTIADGDYTSLTLYENRRDDVGRICRNIDKLKGKLVSGQEAETERQAAQEQQAGVVRRLSEGLKNLSDGDLTQQIDEEFAADYEELRHNFNNTVDKMTSIIGTVVENAARIRSGASEISQSSDDLSNRTESQAATLEETAAAMEELTVSVRSAADSARTVEGIVQDAKKTAENSDTVVSDAVTAMGKIETSSSQISQIITVIDDISFQTNLLALNAGVEAARAGEAGRGFAVVASEVRALAQRSSDAAGEIKGLISESAQHVNHGVDLVGRAGEELKKITERVSEISEHVTGIASGAAEQATTLGEINTGVSQLDQVTQQNAAMVEQATAASQLLKNDAVSLTQQVSVFKTGNAPAPMPTAHDSFAAQDDDPFEEDISEPSAYPTKAAVGWDDF